MGRTADRLPVFSSNGPEIKWEPNDEEYRSLEAVLGADISQAARDGLKQICRNYLVWRKAELGASLKSDVFDVWTGKGKNDGVRQTIERLIALGDGAYPRQYNEDGTPIEAGRMIEVAFFEGLQAACIALTKADLKPQSLAPDYSNDAYENAGPHLYVSKDFMRRLAAVFRDAIQHVENELESLGEGIKPGQALSDWLEEMISWAKQYGYPHVPSSGGSESRFSRLLFNVQRMMPSDLRETRMASASAMNQRLRRYLEQASSK